jgi:hypothetical protein
MLVQTLLGMAPFDTGRGDGSPAGAFDDRTMTRGIVGSLASGATEGVEFVHSVQMTARAVASPAISAPQRAALPATWPTTVRLPDGPIVCAVIDDNYLLPDPEKLFNHAQPDPVQAHHDDVAAQLRGLRRM